MGAAERARQKRMSQAGQAGRVRGSITAVLLLLCFTRLRGVGQWHGYRVPVVVVWVSLGVGGYIEGVGQFSTGGAGIAQWLEHRTRD